MDRIASDLPTILPLIVTKLTTTDHLFNSGGVILSLANDDEMVEAARSDRFLAIRCGRFQIHQGVDAGAGRAALAHDGTLDISLFSRLSTDRQSESLEYLTDSAQGVLLCWAEVLQSLQHFDPSDGTYWLLNEPMRCTHWDTEIRTVRRASPGWGKLQSTWELKFTQRLNYASRLAGEEFS